MLKLSKNDVRISTQDGTADCYFVHPTTRSHPGVILWPDALGLRPAYQAIGNELASAGYSVLVVNPYYRSVTAPIDVDMEGFTTEPGRAKVMSFANAVTPDMTTADAVAFAGYLDQQDSVDSKRKLGAIGYCLGGAMAVRAAVGVADRIGAIASFHGARLVIPEASSPHLRIPETKSAALIAIAEGDDEKAPAVKNLLRDAYDKANLTAEIEVYAGTQHGWCVPDAKAYDPAQAERAWSRLLALFGARLA
jgi:carboxymethylenebutenolidase